MTDDDIIAVILDHEGSTFTNDPDDAGGPTKYGITLTELRMWRGQNVTVNDVISLTRDEAAYIYRARYIRPFDTLTDPLRVNVIDMGVNAGVRRATMLLQQMVGTDVDAWIGPYTLKALEARSSELWNWLYVGMRIAFYERLVEQRPQNVKFRHGWRNRALAFMDGTVPHTLAQGIVPAKSYG